METIDCCAAEALASLAPPPKMLLSEWIEGNVYLPEGVSGLPGRVRLWPFQREIADAIGDPRIERVTLVKPVRVGFTTLLTGALASYVANEPAPILSLLPTESDCRGYVVDDLEPIFEHSPALEGLLTGDVPEGGRNTLLSRRFPGGSLKVVAAKAPRNLRRHNVRVLFMDEVDGMAPSAEGSPIDLAERRTLSFPDRKIVLGSTPVLLETSNVLRAWEKSDQRVFEVPCPECGAFNEIEWANIEWPDSAPEEAAYRCPHCEALIDERHKVGMVNRGRFRALMPAVPGHAGFRLNILVSPHANASWGKLAKEWIEAKDDPLTLQPFINTYLAQGWRGGGDELDDAVLLGRAEAFGLDAIPAEVLAITVGVDVQDDRLEAAFWGWAEDGTAFALGHSVIYGDYDDELTWAELDAAISSTWRHPLGGRIGVDAVAVDSSDGDHRNHVYGFCFPRRKVFAIKGDEGNRPPIEASKGKVKGRGRLFIVGVDTIKRQILKRAAKGRSVRFSEDLAPVWFEQFTSERAVTKYNKGRPFLVFERMTGRRAEALDASVYAWAVRHTFTPNWDVRQRTLVQDGFANMEPRLRTRGVRSKGIET